MVLNVVIKNEKPNILGTGAWRVKIVSEHGSRWRSSSSWPVRGAGRVDGLTRDKMVHMFKGCFNEIASTMAAWCITRLSLFLVTDHPKNSHLALHCSSALQSQKAVYDYFTSKKILPFVFAEQSLHDTYHIYVKTSSTDITTMWIMCNNAILFTHMGLII